MELKWGETKLAKQSDIFSVHTKHKCNMYNENKDFCINFTITF